MTCGITVAPMIPTARSTLSVPSKPGTNPLATPEPDGLATNTCERERPTMTPTSAAITASSRRNPRRLQREDRERGRAREQGGGEERDVEEELEADRGADELGDVGRHRDDLRLDPEPRCSCAREPVAADLGQVLAGRDAELRAHRLDEHRHEVRREDDPEQEVAELRPGRHVRREVPRVDVGDGCDEGGAEEGPEAAYPAAPARERLLCGVEDPGLAREDIVEGMLGRGAVVSGGRVRARPTVLASRLRRPARPPPCSRNSFPSRFR